MSYGYTPDLEVDTTINGTIDYSDTSYTDNLFNDTSNSPVVDNYDWLGGVTKFFATVAPAVVSIFGITQKQAVSTTDSNGNVIKTGYATYQNSSSSIPAGYVYNSATGQYVNPTTGAAFNLNGSASIDGMSTQTILLIGGGVIAAILLYKVIAK
jgi:hypothetical protein